MARRIVWRARHLKVEGTDAERALWRLLRSRQLAGAKFRRQHPIGPFVADFACIELKLVIEVDGGQHDAGASGDALRTAAMERRSWRVMRFWNNDVLQNPEGVMRVIAAALESKSA